MSRAGTLTDAALERTLRDAVRKRAKLTAEILEHLVEVERRDLHLLRAFNSMFAYCTGALGMSEGSARKHLFVARKARKYPVLLDAIADGRLHLSGACAISARLTEDNCNHLLWHASGKTRRAIEEMLAARFPQPDVPPTLRRLPHRSAAQPKTERRPTPAAPAPEPSTPTFKLTPPDPTLAQPLSAQRFKLTVTIDRATWEALQRLAALRKHANPSGDLATVVSEAVVHELERVEKRRFGSSRPRKSRTSKRTRHSRPIPATIRRQVRERDGGRCTYVCPDTGRRCNSDDAIELHHLDPWAIHHHHDAARITQRCRAHNQYQGRLDFGAAHIQAHIEHTGRHAH